MNIMKCVFIRYQNSDEEYGIIINEGALIIDKDGKPVTNPLWSYQVLPHELCININLDFESSIKN